MNTIQMLASSSHQHKSYEDLHPPPPPHDLQPTAPVENSHLRQLLLTAAQLISHSDLPAASRLLSVLSSHSSAHGDSSDRIIHYFTKALNGSIHKSNQYDLQSAYLTLNHITPFIRFIHLTANQAILEAMDQSQHIHIIDFDIMQGVQWPPLMQAIADQYPPPALRITATGVNLSILRRTGDRLSKFAQSIGLRFSFNLINTETLAVDHIVDRLSDVLVSPNETLAVNCVLYLHRKANNRRKLCLLLNKIKSMSPAVVTLSEQEINHNCPLLLSRFTEALSYYTAVFDSLEATLPATSHERMEVEKVWFGEEIANIVTDEGGLSEERHEQYRHEPWEVMMMSGGFVKVPLSDYALTQAKLLLRVHYPCEGYNLEVVDGSFFLGWRNRPLYSVSSWR